MKTLDELQSEQTLANMLELAVRVSARSKLEKQIASDFISSLDRVKTNPVMTKELNLQKQTLFDAAVEECEVKAMEASVKVLAKASRQGDFE